MGIPSFFSYIIKRYDKTRIIKERLSINPTHFFLDLNGMIHPCSHKVLQEVYEETTDPMSIPLNVIEDRICKKTINSILDCVKKVNPSEVLYIAIDGVAPRAKMEQQRKRRFKSAQDKKLDPSVQKTTRWDSNAITPGTAFMEKLGKMLRHSQEIKSIPVNEIIISDAFVPMEGEHKLMNYIRKNLGEDAVCVVHGLDADLIMLSILLSPTIYLYREDAQRKSTYYMDTSFFTECVVHHFSQLLHFVPEDTRDLLRDYVFLCFFMGNDFLPHHYGLEIRDEAIDLVLDIYADITNKVLPRKTLTYSNGKINIKFLMHFIERLSQQEDDLVIERTGRIVYKQAIRHGHTEQDKFTYFPDYHRNIEKRINFGEADWRKRYYDYVELTAGKRNVSREHMINDMCIIYLQGLEWNLSYYLGRCISTTWYYPYLHAPCLCDLLVVLKNGGFPGIKRDSRSYSPLEQLLLVLPPQSFRLLPRSWQPLMKQRDLYPLSFRLDPVGSIFRWQCPPILHIHDDAEFLTSCRNLPLSAVEERRKKMYTAPFIIRKKA